MTASRGKVGAILDGLFRRLLARSEQGRNKRLLWQRVSEVRRRYRGLDAARKQEARRAARRLAGLRESLARLTGSPECCRDCARRLAAAASQPAPLLAGGYCCGGDPERIFCELEVAALWLAGRTPSRWAMVAEPAGCFFRGSRGCRLPPADRPSICLRYFCGELTAGLARSGALSDILICCDSLEVEMARIGELLGLDGTRQARGPAGP